MSRRISSVILMLLCCAVFSSCADTLYEPLASDAVLMPDEMSLPDDYLPDELIPPVKHGEVLRVCRMENELFLHVRDNVSFRLDYEKELDALWYESLPLTPAMNDRISTWLHPTGWRIAIYDNRRSERLRESYGADEYVFELRIKKIDFDGALFPRYPEGDKNLWFDPEELRSFDEMPLDLLPEGLTTLPENSLFLRSRLAENGLFVTYITTYDDYENYLSRLIEDEIFFNAGYCYANGNGDYFYVYEVASIKIVNEDDESKESTSELENESIGAEVSRLKEELRTNYKLSELPPLSEEPTDSTYCKITLQVVRSEWLPEWWGR